MHHGPCDTDLFAVGREPGDVSAGQGVRVRVVPSGDRSISRLSISRPCSASPRRRRSCRRARRGLGSRGRCVVSCESAPGFRGIDRELPQVEVAAIARRANTSRCHRASRSLTVDPGAIRESARRRPRPATVRSTGSSYPGSRSRVNAKHQPATIGRQRRIAILRQRVGARRARTGDRHARRSPRAGSPAARSDAMIAIGARAGLPRRDGGGVHRPGRHATRPPRQRDRSR